jgi:protein SYS1
MTLVEFFHVEIVSMQTLHYLTLCILIPPLLDLFAEPSSLLYEGGAASVGASSVLRI